MFYKNLSATILSICESRELSYEAASELCDISPRYFGSIARGQTAPTVNTLEKLCIGLEKTPNELLSNKPNDAAQVYRTDMCVVHFRCATFVNGMLTTFPICSHCHVNIECEYQAFCSNCGQKLNWDFYSHATLLTEP